MMTVKTPILTTFSRLFSRSSQAGRPSPMASDWTAISCRPPLVPSPDGAKRNRSTVCASNGRRGRSSVVDPFLSHPVREFIGSDDEEGADDALDQASRGRDAPLTADDALEVDVRIEHLACCWTDRVALEQDLLETDRQDQAQTQDQQQDDDAH